MTASTDRIMEPQRETVFEVGIAGGSLSIRRGLGQDGRPFFSLNRNENALFSLLDVEDCEDSLLEEDFPPVATFTLALREITYYQWYRMTPVTVHAEYLDEVVTEVARLGTVQDVQRWHQFVADGACRDEQTMDAHEGNGQNPARYPDRKVRKLSEDEKATIRHRLTTSTEDTHALAKEFRCAATQIAGIKARMSRHTH